MGTLIESPAVPRLAMRGDVHLLPVGARRWRVVLRGGLVAGQLEARGEGPSRRYGARRFHAPSAGFRDVGEFWTPEEAVECLRLYR